MDILKTYPVVPIREWRKSKTVKKASALEIVQIATQYVTTFDRCLRPEFTTPTTFKLPIFPAFVCAAFGIELAIKAILTKNNLAPPFSHNLLELYRLLPIADQNAICTTMQMHPAAVQMQLHPIQHGFEDWRYIYETGFVNLSLDFVGKLLKASVQIAQEATKETI